ncbi:MAG: endonuclease III, partial [Nitrososphaerota archaeon]
MSANRLDPKERVLEIIRLLEKEHPDAKIALKFSNPLELLVATMLSAQCTDQKVNEVTQSLFKKYRTAEDYAKADLKTFEQEIKQTGFYHNKAKNIKNACQMLVDKFNSEVPRTMEELMMLPGVARKTANIVLSNAYGIVQGIAVDTHVRRVSKRLGLTDKTDQNKIEKDLTEIVPREKWARFTDLL